MIIREKPEEDRKRLIGPHEGRELELMLKGEKPLAMFNEVVGHDEEFELIPEKEFQPYVDSGEIVRREKIFDTSYKEYPHVRYVFYALSSEAHRIDQIIKSKNDWKNKLISGEEEDRRTGHLLGYSKEAVEYFIKRWNIRRASEQITEKR